MFFYLDLFARKLMFLKYSCQKPVKKNTVDGPAFLEELQAPRNFSKVSLHFSKIPNFLRPVLQAYSERYKKSSPEAVDKN